MPGKEAQAENMRIEEGDMPVRTRRERVIGGSQQMAAAKAGVSLATWQKIERGDPAAYASTLAKVAASLEWTIGELRDAMAHTRGETTEPVAVELFELDERLRYADAATIEAAKRAVEAILDLVEKK